MKIQITSQQYKRNCHDFITTKLTQGLQTAHNFNTVPSAILQALCYFIAFYNCNLVNTKWCKSDKIQAAQFCYILSPITSENKTGSNSFSA